MIVDGLPWYDLPPDLLAVGADDPRCRQMLIRALTFRLVALSGLA